MAKHKESANGAPEGDTTAGETVGTVVQIGVGELTFPVTSRFAAGHTITDAEASALNQLVRENLRNTFRPVVAKATAKAKEEGRSLSPEEIETLATAFSERERSYSFASARGPRTPTDPVGREAHKIAKGIVLGALARQKVDVKTLPEGKLEELITGAIAKYPKITEEARNRVEAAKAFAEGILIGGDEATA